MSFILGGKNGGYGLIGSVYEIIIFTLGIDDRPYSALRRNLLIRWVLNFIPSSLLVDRLPQSLREFRSHIHYSIFQLGCPTNWIFQLSSQCTGIRLAAEMFRFPNFLLITFVDTREKWLRPREIRNVLKIRVVVILVDHRAGLTVHPSSPEWRIN